jgi:hypothetical protein
MEGLICLKYDIYISEMPSQNPLGLSIHLKKNEGQEGKIGLFQGWVPGVGRWAQGKGEWGEYGGCFLHPCMKREG